jgi:alpha-methylacyl-CoA racemase
MDAGSWPEMKRRFAAIFRTKTRAEWEVIFADKDACVAPVLSPKEAMTGAHLKARGAFTEVAGVVQPAPAPRFSRTPGAIRRPPPTPGQHTAEALADWGFTEARIRELTEAGTIG